MGAQALLTRLKSSLIRRTGIGNHATQLAQVQEKLAKRNEELRKVRRQVRKQNQELAGLQATLRASTDKTPAGGIRPENIIWIFGTARTGSTWLSALMGDSPRHEEWREPYVGNLFGAHYYRKAEGKYTLHGNKHWNSYWILGGHRGVWINSVRSFVLDGARARFPDMTETGYLVVKEPHGSMGAPLLMEALPESRMILLIRDPRDVASSALKARKRGSWLYERKHARFGGEDTLGDVPSKDTIRGRAEKYMSDVGKAKEAYEAHKGYKVLVRYEELRADTLGTLKRIYRALNIPMDDEELARMVEKHSFENIPEGERGPDKFRRKATPGGWREDLTPEQIKTVESITAPLLREYYGSEVSEPSLRFAE